ncbi:unnamed protein product, partial [marine sediment metagenome]
MARPKSRSRPAVEARVAELAALRKAGGRGAVARFVAALRDPALPVAKTAAMGLCDRGLIVEPLSELLRETDPNLRWRACALAWFFMVRDFVPHLIRALRDPDRMVRAEAAWAMRCASTNAAVAALRRAMGDPERIVAHYAAWVLRRIIRPQHPRLSGLRGLRIPALPLRPERRPRPLRAAPVEDDALAFEQFACSAELPVYRACARARSARLMHIDGYP